MTPAPKASTAETIPLSSPAGFKVWRPGLLDYRDAQLYQEELVAQRSSWSHDLLILLEHPSVITMGRNTDPNNLRSSPADLQQAGIDCVSSRRGGGITLHNPGQLVGYPIVDLNHYHRDLHLFLRLIEQCLILTMADFELSATTVPGTTGVWVDNKKIASIGIAVRRWISYHGFALNIDNDLSAFEAIVPCGLPDISMTSMARELGQPIDSEAVAEALTLHFSTILQRPYLGDCQTMSDRLQTQLFGPYFSSFSAHNCSYELSNEPKSALKLLDSRFDPYSRTGS